MANTKITSRVIADNAVTTAAIADDAITSAKLDTNIAVAGTLTVTGDITGTLATAAQPNITSVGTLTGFTSTGIDDNADATAITIDSDENILIGTDTLDAWYTSTNAGVNITNASNFIAVARSGGVPFIANRLSSDGNIMEFKKDGAPIGTIGVSSSGNRVYFAGSGDSLCIDANLNAIFSGTTTGSGTNNTLDIGTSSTRFKDLYLSGGAYLGGTGSANHLDDYEEGTWTPNIKRGNGTVPASYNSVNASYVKIGNIVHAKVFISNLSNGSSDGTIYWVIYNIPFAASVETYSGVALAYNSSPCDNCYVGDAGGNAVLCVGSSPYSGAISGAFMLNITYRVN